jgi:hypothetical protein
MIDDSNWRDRIAIWVAWHLPRRIVLWCMIRAFAHATTGRWSNETLDSVGYKEVHDRWMMPQRVDPQPAGADKA